MKILTKEQMKKAPSGTVFTTCLSEYCLDGGMHVITRHLEEYPDIGWLGELTLHPSCVEEKGGDLFTQWCVDDTASFDYEDDQLFAVFNKEEIVQMMKVLGWALYEHDLDLNQDEWIGENGELKYFEE